MQHLSSQNGQSFDHKSAEIKYFGIIIININLDDQQNFTEKLKINLKTKIKDLLVH